MEKRNQSFGRLLKAAMASVGHIEGKTQQGIEQEFGVLLGVAGVTLQRYKAGFIPPDLKRVELLAEVGVRRGFLGRPWLDRFLAAANVSVHHGRTLTALLFPEAAALAARNLKPSNLPAPTYAHFVMRRAAYEATLDGLRSALPATLIFSIGGMGKTSLARAVCADCLARAPRAPIFATVVWISDKDHPGNTNLSSALNTIARALDYPGLASSPFAERLREVEGLLRSQPVLLVLDNADSITDDALMEWVVCLPEPSKALITSRSLLPSTANVYLVELEPMNEKEAEALIASRAPGSRLRRSMASLDQLIPIAQAAGGNPKAIELALGLVQQRPRDAVLADLTGARLDLFDELFARAWALLDSYAQRVLLALPLFPGSASAEALAACAELSPDALTRTTDQLSGLALLDVERGDLLSYPRYNAHPLVRAFAQARLAGAPSTERAALQDRWVAWCVAFAQGVGFCWDDLDRLSLLDDEHTTIQAAIRLTVELGNHAATVALVEGVRYFYNVRGLWGEVELQNNLHRATAAHALGDRDDEALALAHYAEILSKQARLVEAAEVMVRLTNLAGPAFHSRLAGDRSGSGEAGWLSDTAAFEYGHALGLYARAQGQSAEAEACWRALLALSERLGGQKYVVNRRWLATILLEGGNLTEARHHFVTSLDDARRIFDMRSVTGNALKLAAVDLLQGNPEAAEAVLNECRSVATRYRDRRRLAECHWLTAQICLRRGEQGLAHEELKLALDLFERLGMGAEAVKVRQLIEN